MFFDERIESQSGKIFRKGILFATILAAAFTVCKVLNYREFVFWDIFSFLAEATVILSGAIVLLYGEFFRERCDDALPHVRQRQNDSCERLYASGGTSRR